MTKKERRNTAKYLKKAMEQIFKTIENLTEEQWNYQASAESWSVAGACEHLLIAEHATLRLVQNKIQTDEYKNAIGERIISDDEVITFIRDRSPERRVKTLQPFEPKGNLKTPQDFIQQYRMARQATIDYLETTNDDLKSYYYTGPAGTISGYQWIILMAAHSERHWEQMKEVMEHSNYPL